MKLSQLIKNIRTEKIIGDSDTEIEGLCADSNKVRSGDLFFCYAGGEYDSHDFAEQAAENGAVAIICEREIKVNIPQVIVKNGRAAVAPVARSFYGYADRKLKLVAITGTNGKTTTAFMLKSIFDKNSCKTGIIGTLGIEYCGKFISPELTTPDPIFLHGIFADMQSCGVEYVFMEVSAHALYYNKVEGLHFEVGIFTNCTQDHLDFFGDMKSYAECKKKLFTGGMCSVAVLNSDDGLGAELINMLPECVSYGLESPADTFAVNLVGNADGSSFVMNLFDELYDVKLNMPAVHNVYNALAAATAAKVLGVDVETIAAGLGELKRVPGRLEKVATFNGGDVFVDFAHTPDGLEKALSALRKICDGKLYCVFGCGGNRDKSKRPIMGEIAARYSDFVIVTSDNPRYEDPYVIISQIETGLKRSSSSYVTVTERETAIEYALNLLEAGDVLLIAGKGAENYQEIMGIKHIYNDGATVKKIIGR